MGTEGRANPGQDGDKPLVTVHVTDNAGQVAVLKMAMSQAGIPYIAVNDVVGAMLPFCMTTWVKFQVRQHDAVEARRVLQELGIGCAAELADGAQRGP